MNTEAPNGQTIVDRIAQAVWKLGGESDPETITSVVREVIKMAGVPSDDTDMIEILELAEEIEKTEHLPLVRAVQRAAILFEDYYSYAEEWDINAMLKRIEVETSVQSTGL